MSELMSDSWSVWPKFTRKRYLLLLLILAIIVAFYPFGIPIPANPATVDFYDEVEALPDGSVVWIGWYHDIISFYHGSRDVYRALLHQLASHDHKILFMAYGRESALVSEDLVKRNNLDSAYGYVYGEDYVIFPFLSGEESAMALGAENLFTAYSVDARGNALSSLPLLETVKGMEDVDLVIFQSHIITIPHMYVRQWPVKYGTRAISMGGYTTVGPYYGTFVFGAIDSAAEYELYVGRPGEELAKSDMANLENILMVGLITIGLIHSLMTRNKETTIGGVTK
jgi:hypothetical protein